MYLYHVLLYILVQLKYLLSIQGSVISEKPTCKYIINSDKQTVAAS